MKNAPMFQNMIGDRVLLTQFTDLLTIFIEEESWTELRLEMSKAIPKECRKIMPGFRSAAIIQRPDEQNKLSDTPCVIVRIEGYDGHTYEWEASLRMMSNSQGFETTGQIHLVSVPADNFYWIPETAKG